MLLGGEQGDPVTPLGIREDVGTGVQGAAGPGERVLLAVAMTVKVT
jgi:hypothetical protein